jgi:hypothetical protein
MQYQFTNRLEVERKRMYRSLLVLLAAVTPVCIAPALSFGALAKKAGAAGTSSTTSSNPTVKAQANLMDPEESDPDGSPLVTTFARLDVDIHYSNLPPTFTAFNLVQSISVTPFVNTADDPNFQANQTAYGYEAANTESEPLPAYNFDTASNSVTLQTPNVTISGNDVILHDIAVQLDPSKPMPLAGDLNTAEVHIQYFKFDSFGGVNYNDIVASYTTTADPDAESSLASIAGSTADAPDGFLPSAIEAVDSFGNVSDYLGNAPDPNNPDDPANDGTILPSTSIQTLGGVNLPEPAMLGLFALLPVLSRKMRK